MQKLTPEHFFTQIFLLWKLSDLHMVDVKSSGVSVNVWLVYTY